MNVKCVKTLSRSLATLVRHGKLRRWNFFSPDFNAIYNHAAIKVGKVVKDKSQLARGSVNCERLGLNGVDILKFHRLQCLELLIFLIEPLDGT